MMILYLLLSLLLLVTIYCNLSSQENYAVIKKQRKLKKKKHSKKHKKEKPICDWRLPKKCIFKDYQPTEYGTCIGPVGNPSYNVQELNSYDVPTFTNWLQILKNRNNGNVHGKKEADNVIEYANRCKKEPGYNFLKPELLEQLTCDWKQKNKCIFKDYKTSDGQTCVGPDGNPSYNIPGLNSYDQPTFTNWLQTLKNRNNGNVPGKKEADNVMEYVNRCKNTPGLDFLKPVNFKSGVKWNSNNGWSTSSGVSNCASGYYAKDGKTYNYQTGTIDYTFFGIPYISNYYGTNCAGGYYLTDPDNNNCACNSMTDIQNQYLNPTFNQ